MRKAALIAAETELAESASASASDELLSGVTGRGLYQAASIPIRRTILAGLLPAVYVKRGRAPVADRIRFEENGADDVQN